MSSQKPSPFALNSNRPKPTRLAPQKWERIRADYVNGVGSLRELARQHGARLSTVEARCRRERWTELRQQREASALRALTGSPLTTAQPAPVEDSEWWTEKSREHLVSNLAACARLRDAAELKIPDASATELERLAGALAAIANTERELLELTPRSARHNAPSLRPIASSTPAVFDVPELLSERLEKLENTDH